MKISHAMAIAALDRALTLKHGVVVTVETKQMQKRVRQCLYTCKDKDKKKYAKLSICAARDDTCNLWIVNNAPTKAQSGKENSDTTSG